MKKAFLFPVANLMPVFFFVYRMHAITTKKQTNNQSINTKLYHDFVWYDRILSDDSII